MELKARQLLTSPARLRRRLDELEAEVQEARQLNLRVAELVDAVTELLVPLADSDDPRVAEIIERYRLGVSTEGHRAR
ncbi:DUF6752 domain-containing protein [Nocardioides litoris]|uniref:DUF6752 domain-containing protein n=1 Tax=Nocardioides litoris TaxID=1926648 RepID=UPI00111E5198|nr:DUF6752 domain-containing protein [Nocardioides litoris]